uniref:FAD-binding domain-containing protein n=1 Tax=Helicotheca tamesis TaxID=374047 RepID=A0A7S2HK05_9STRA|mmetsp:Transcript_18804/g.25880  ORF Transcript_18804/g.25880 Transcript_18804/m.25880 type:complete len:446 (+) Transcript_18804:99-1436(+)|eukprot:CAMPEP_0185724286 /NCGR_PEP_ID=MMETSP1171-20130828/809_1 /TAXON_ID=374046 /ORGANISM="Helicotheca tamensis, Strain CCMP826" /LENGTH=445 /DNA_ID=CAMNT_0028392103 /DNA_START=72 /DNA_END=1409 /DNA_ORIENTATION=-
MCNPSPHNKHESLVIVGGGPVGMLTALLYKDTFSSITILERQSKEKFFASRYTFPVVFTPAALNVMKQVDGLLKALKPSQSPYQDLEVKFKVLGKWITIVKKFEGLNSSWRDTLVKVEHELILKTKNISMHFGCELKSIDFDQNICHEATLGAFSYDLLIGADGCHSQTRQLLAEAHPLYDPKTDFKKDIVKRWHTFALPITKEVDRDYCQYHANLTVQTGDKSDFALIASVMRYPKDVVSYLISAPPSATDEEFKEVKEKNFPYFSEEEMKKHNDESAISGHFYHVTAPTFCYKSCVLLGDAAHSWQSSGDLLSIGFLTVGKLLSELQKAGVSIPNALKAYDESVGECVRFYSNNFAYPRSAAGMRGGEIATFSTLSKIGLTGTHPTVDSIYREGFDLEYDMKQYVRDLDTINHFKMVMLLLTFLSIFGALVHYKVIEVSQFTA